ncbi:MAG: hypothetical protein HC767_06635 [Akkermansiaceae bacterium]|nr:hypothetical protein [Akkermansiaceae bacterium]
MTPAPPTSLFCLEWPGVVGVRGGVRDGDALSEYLNLEIRRDGKVWFQKYERGNAVTELKESGTTERTGTRIRFKPDPQIFPKVEFDPQIIRERLEVASLLQAAAQS